MTSGYFKKSIELMKQEPIFIGFYALFFVGLKFFALTMPQIDPNQIDGIEALVGTFLPYIIPYIGTIAAEVFVGVFVLVMAVSYIKSSELNIKEGVVTALLRFATLFLAHFGLMLVLGVLVVGLLYGFNSGLNPINILLALSSGFLAVFASLAVMLYIPTAILYEESPFGAFGRLRRIIQSDFRGVVSVLVLSFAIEFLFQMFSVLFGQIPIVGGTLIDVVVFSVSNTLTTFIVMFYVLQTSQPRQVSIVIEDHEDTVE